MWFRIAALAAVLMAAGAMVANDTGADPSPMGRYQITGTNSRVWRVDTVTGELRTCFEIKRHGDRTYRCLDLH